MFANATIQSRATRRGLYETYDISGLSADGRYAWLLKHTVFRPLWRGGGLVEAALICFDRITGARRCVVERESLEGAHLKQIQGATDWRGFSFSFGSGSFFEIGRDVLRGKLHAPGGPAAWSLALDRRDEALQPLPSDFFYRLPWPRHKVRLDDCALGMQGRLRAGDLVLEGVFQGTSRHYWGDGYPHEFAAAQCSRFEGQEEAFFYGLSTRLSLGKLRSPYLGVASLKWRGRWHHFNQPSASFRHRLEALDNYRWRITFLNREYGLEVEVDGGNPRITPWTAWHAEHPLGGRSVIKLTPFARGTLVLYRRRNGERVAELKSGHVELKTLLPENLPEGGGFLAEA